MNQLYAERYPNIAFLLSISETKREAASAVATTVPQTEVVYHLGIAEGKRFLYLEEWLSECERRRLLFLDDRIDPFAALLEMPYAKQLINHPQVELHYVQDWDESLEYFAALYPEAEITVDAPSTLQTQKEELLKKTWLTYSLSIDITRADGIFANVIANIKQLPHTFSTTRLKNHFCNTPALICGAGPSLLQEVDPTRYLVIAGGSAIPILSKRGVEPHFSIAFDPNPEEFDRLKQSDNFSVPLLFGARVNHKATQLGHFPLGYIPSNTGGFACSHLEKELGLEPLLNTLSHEAQTVTTAAIAFAAHLGCDPIILSGVDLAYKEGQQYAPGIEESGAKKRRRGPMGDPLIRVGDLYSSLVWQLEAQTLSSFAANHPATFLNLSQGLDIPSIPRIKKMPHFSQKDLYGKVYAALCHKNQQQPEGPIATFCKSISDTKALMERYAEGSAREKTVIEWELEEEVAYNAFIKPLSLFSNEDDLINNSINLLKRLSKI